MWQYITMIYAQRYKIQGPLSLVVQEKRLILDKRLLLLRFMLLVANIVPFPSKVNRANRFDYLA